MPTMNPTTKEPVTIADYRAAREKSPSIKAGGGVGEYLYNLQKQQTPAPQQTPATNTAPSQSIYDLYGMKSSNNSKIQDPYALYDIKAPERKVADTSKYDALIDRYQPKVDYDRIQRQLDDELASIRARYGVIKEDAKKQTESERQSSISGLYNLGVSNPLSSGTQSITTANRDILDRRLTSITAQESAEIAAATARAYGMETEGEQRALEFAQAERDRIQEETDKEYQNERQQMIDKVEMVNNAVNAWQAGRKMDIQEKEIAKENVMDLISTFGSSAFDGMDSDAISNLEKATGYPEGSLSKGIAQLKEQELLQPEKEMTLRTIGGNLYNVYRDANGAVKADLVVSKGLTGGSGGGGGSKKKASDAEQFQKWLGEKEQKDGMTYNIGDQNILQELIGMWEQSTGKNKSNLIEDAMGGGSGNKIEFTNTQYKKALNNYASAQGLSIEQAKGTFDKLPNTQKAQWEYSGNSSSSNKSSSSGSSSGLSIPTSIGGDGMSGSAMKQFYGDK